MVTLPLFAKPAQCEPMDRPNPKGLRFVSAPPKPLEGYWEDSEGIRYEEYPLTTDKKQDTLPNAD